MNKPNWDDAPQWANWLAMDLDGTWYWYELEPVLDFEEWGNNGGKHTLAQEPLTYWDESIEERPND